MRTSRAIAVVSAVGAAVTITTACGSSTGTSNAPLSSSAAPTAAAGGKAFGTTIATSSGAMYTVLAWQQVQPKTGTDTPSPGGAFFAANVQECAGSGPALTTDPTAWTALLSGGEQAVGRDATRLATPGPPLATGATVASGQCVGGWVGFNGFADGIGRQVHFTAVDSFWLVP